VDPGENVQVLPASLPAGALREFPDEASAGLALQAGEISSYYLIPVDYLATGELVYVRPDFNPLSAFDRSSTMEWVLQVNLLGGDEALAARVSAPLDLETVNLAPTPQRDADNPLTFFIPYGVTMVYYLIILMASSFLLNSLTKEKENRVIEVLMSSVTPRQLLAGKILGLGLVGLLQAVLWVGTGYLLLRLSGRAFSLPAEFQLPLSFLLWGMVFFLLGYGLYASLMAGVGALVPNLREASQATFVVILPLLIPLMMISLLVEEPDGALAVGLSLFPLTAPVVMMTRLASGAVPLWQLLLSAGIQALTVVALVRAAAGMFRTQTLLAGQAFTWKMLFASWVGR
jgi:ABC-2 type transport system permease protein